jgi:hypothetical protein
MFSTLRTRFGIPGVISVMALVFAMFGGAYAASNSSDGGKATASAKAKKGPRGPKGAKGDTGAAGPQGPAGPAGAKGDAGAAGANGASVTNVKLNFGNANCPEGGTEFKVGVGAATFACNGEEGLQGSQGIQGKEGSPWVAGKVPAGVVMKGTWSLPPYSAAAAGEELFVPITTGVPVGGELIVSFGPEPSSPCTGSAENPTSSSQRVLCLYPNELVNIEPELFGPFSTRLGTSGGGAVASLVTLAAGVAKGYGSWALLTP